MTDGKQADRLPWLGENCRRDRRLARARLVRRCHLFGLGTLIPDIIIASRPEVHLAYLIGSYRLIRSRLAVRHEHFMAAALLESQFSTLDEPISDEHSVSGQHLSGYRGACGANVHC